MPLPLPQLLCPSVLSLSLVPLTPIHITPLPLTPPSKQKDKNKSEINNLCLGVFLCVHAWTLLALCILPGSLYQRYVDLYDESVYLHVLKNIPLWDR